MTPFLTFIALGMGLAFSLSAQGLAYIGIHAPGEAWVYKTTTLDSVYYMDLATGQPLMALGGSFSTLDDSLWVIDTLTMGGTFMYGVEEQVPRFLDPNRTSRERYGTWDASDTVYQEIDVPQQRFVTPFTTGSVWRLYPTMPLNQWIPVDVDGDGDLDTLFLENDSVRVVGQEPVTVPAGTYTAWHLDTWMHRRIRYSGDSSVNVLDSMVWQEETHAWWVPGFGMVRDSTHLIISEYGFFPDTFIVGKRQPIVRTLLSSTTPVQESAVPHPQPQGLRVQVRPGGLRLMPLVPGIHVRIQDPLGRVRFAGRVFSVRTVALPGGIYVITEGRNRRTVLVP